MTPDGFTSGVVAALDAAIRGFSKRKRMSVSEWADSYRVLTEKGSPEPGRWRTSRNPMLREIMDCLSEHSSVRDITIMKASQVGVTEGPFVATVGYYMAHTPSSIMVLMPTIVSRNKWRVQKLQPMLDHTDCVKELIDERAFSAKKTQDIIDCANNALLYLAGGNSRSSYDQASIRVLLMDDLDRFPPFIKDEGDPVSLGKTRLKAFDRTYKFLRASTPTVEGYSLIQREYEAGDQREYHVQCPHCAEYIVLKMEQLFADENLTEAWYVCEHCGSEIQEAQKTEMLRERGYGGTAHWRPKYPQRKKHRSYHISSLNAPLGLGPSWVSLVKQAREAEEEDDEGKKQVHCNSNLGLPYSSEVTKLETHELMRRASEDVYQMGDIPPGYLVVTMGVDTQDGWLEYVKMGWGYDHEMGERRYCIIDHGQIVGDTTGSGVWDELEAEVNRPILNSYGKSIMIKAVAVDSRGHRAEQVRNFVMRDTLKVKVYAIQGATGTMYKAIASTGSYRTKNARGKIVRRGYCTWNVGTVYCKSNIYKRLASDGTRPVSERFFRFPDGLNESFYNGLLSETYVESKKKYVVKKGAKYKRNEPLDCTVYAWAIGDHVEVRLGRTVKGKEYPRYWQRLADMLEPADAQPLETDTDADGGGDNSDDNGSGQSAARKHGLRRRKRRRRGGGFVGKF